MRQNMHASAHRAIDRHPRGLFLKPAPIRPSPSAAAAMAAEEVYIVGAARTPIGSFTGALSGVSAAELGSVAVRAALERASVKPEQVDEVIMGQVLTAGILFSYKISLEMGC